MRRYDRCLHVGETEDQELTEAHAEMDKRHTTEFEQMLEPVRKMFSERRQIIPVLIGQLKDVTEQTEKAAIDIVERFMSIVERAQNQSEQASAAVTALLEEKKQTAETL